MFDLVVFGEKMEKKNRLMRFSSICANTRESRNQSGIGLASIFSRFARVPCFSALGPDFVLSCPVVWRWVQACFPALGEGPRVFPPLVAHGVGGWRWVHAYFPALGAGCISSRSSTTGVKQRNHT